MYHATDALMAPAKLTPPPCIQVGATAQSPPVPSAHRGDGSTRTVIEGRATTGTELRPARRAHHPYGHRRPAPSHSRPPIGGTAACRPHARGAQGRTCSAGHVEASRRTGAAPMLVRRVREGHAPMNTASTTYSCGYVRRAGAVPVSA